MCVTDTEPKTKFKGGYAYVQETEKNDDNIVSFHLDDRDVSV